MADYLLVVDMQSDYVAVGKAYHEELTAAVNDKIATYPSDRVIYILNRFFWERKDRIYRGRWQWLCQGFRFGSCQGELSGFCRFVCCRSCQPEEIL